MAPPPVRAAPGGVGGAAVRRRLARLRPVVPRATALPHAVQVAGLGVPLGFVLEADPRGGGAVASGAGSLFGQAGDLGLFLDEERSRRGWRGHFLFGLNDALMLLLLLLWLLLSLRLRSWWIGWEIRLLPVSK